MGASVMMVEMVALEVHGDDGGGEWSGGTGGGKGRHAAMKEQRM